MSCTDESVKNALSNTFKRVVCALNPPLDGYICKTSDFKLLVCEQEMVSNDVIKAEDIPNVVNFGNSLSFNM